jgi:hypothetical protein
MKFVEPFDRKRVLNCHIKVAVRKSHQKHSNVPTALQVVLQHVELSSHKLYTCIIISAFIVFICYIMIRKI